VDLARIRREYLRGGLRRAELDPDPLKQLEKWIEDAARVELIDVTAMTLATVDAEGQPSQRTVLLKRLDQQGLVFYTNLGSRKAKDIEQNPKVSAHFAWLAMERQVKILGTAERISTAEAMRYFASRPRDSQLAAWASNQSNPIPSRQFLQQAFESMKQKFAQGKVPLPDFWGGYRIKPKEFEFWQGGGARLHDRFQYSLQADGGWQIQRLAP